MHQNNQFWILDFGANDHVCSSLNLFTSIHSIKTFNIILPIVTQFFFKQASHIQFSSIFYLHDVLCSDAFHLNLISISKHFQSLKYSIEFSLNARVIHDLNTKKMTGLGNEFGSLYTL